MIGVQEANRSPRGVRKEGSESEMLIEGASEAARADDGGEELGEGVEVTRMCSREEVAGPGEGVEVTRMCSDGSDKAMGL